VNKKASYAFVLLALTLLIVLPVVNCVNIGPSSSSGPNHELFASGSPMPPPTPPVLYQSTLVASGSPMPPPTPPVLYQSTLVASGSPMPPPTPPLLNTST
jgi:hypothetical protein